MVNTPLPKSRSYGGLATNFVEGAANNLHGWIRSATGPNAGTFDLTGNSNGTGLGGYNDWYLPAMDELEIMYRYLKPDATANTITAGLNINSYPSNSTYLLNDPGITSVSDFQEFGAQSVWDPAYSIFFSVTPEENLAAGSQKFNRQAFNNGSQTFSVYNSTMMGRAVRRELVEAPMTSSVIAEQKLSFATYENRSQVAEGQKAMAEREALRQSLIADGASALDIARVFAQTVTAQAQAIAGYYPLYETEADADAAGNGSSHSHEFDGVTYYMPDGGVDIYHGNYDSGDSEDSGDSGDSSY